MAAVVTGPTAGAAPDTNPGTEPVPTDAPVDSDGDSADQPADEAEKEPENEPGEVPISIWIAAGVLVWTVSAAGRELRSNNGLSPLSMSSRSSSLTSPTTVLRLRRVRTRR